MNDREKFIILVDQDYPEKSDVIVVLEGDDEVRLKEAKKLYKEGFAPRILLSGGLENSAHGGISSRKMKKKLIKMGVPTGNILIEENSKNTWEQALEVMKIVKGKKWRKILLVASAYHQYRAFLTFLKAMQAAKIKIEIFNTPIKDITWFKKIKWLNNKTRWACLEEELKKIEIYKKKGHIASFKEAILYQGWKEKSKK